MFALGKDKSAALDNWLMWLAQAGGVGRVWAENATTFSYQMWAPTVIKLSQFFGSAGFQYLRKNIIDCL